MQRIVAFVLASVASTTCASGPIPAVNLPSIVPADVRDRVARELASTRDRLSDTVSPFRGEFHGLGSGSEAADLSANGRVVVGANESPGGSIGFVWSPWTGRATYNMLPDGLAGGVMPTVVSADGVYVAGNIETPNGPQGFRWSLAGREAIPAPADGRRTAAGISGNGRTVIGDLVTKTPVDDSVLVPFYGDLSDDGELPAANAGFPSVFRDDVAPGGNYPPLTLSPFRIDRSAYRYDTRGSITELTAPPASWRTAAVDIAAEGGTILGNINPGTVLIQPFRDRQVAQPVLWGQGEPRLLGGLRPTGTDPIAGPLTGTAVLYPSGSIQSTTASAISADGTTVVGTNVYQQFSFFTDAYFFPEQRAVLWREETGWIDLGELPLKRFRFQLDATAVDVSGDGGLVVGNAKVDIGTAILCDCENPDAFIEDAPFLWDQARDMRDLAEVFANDYGLGFDGWDLGEATAISDDGTTIIGNGINPDGDREAWRAVLQRNTPEGDLDFDGDLDADDYQTLTANLGLTSDDAAVYYTDGDLNADGIVSGDDLALLMARYDGFSYGDYNLDGVVNTLDYTAMRDFGHHWSDSPTDIAAWRTNFGMTVGNTGTPIPEPATILGVVALVAAARLRR